MAEDACDRFGKPVETDPFDALEALVWECFGNVAYYRARVQEIDEDALTWGTYEVQEGGKHGGHTKKRATLNVWLRLYHEAQERLESVCKSAIAAGIAERQIELAEQQGRMIARVIQGVLEDLGIDQDEPEVRKTVRKHLTVISGGKAA